MLARSGVDKWPSHWHACNSTHAELHAYPCSLWLLFHSLLAHASEPEALPHLHAIVGYVTNFFGCKDCVGHFAVLAAGLEQGLIELGSRHRHGRDRAMIWLWQTHNKVNERLASECATPFSNHLHAPTIALSSPMRGTILQGINRFCFTALPGIRKSAMAFTLCMPEMPPGVTISRKAPRS